ncbi:hypothetical protein DPMN_066770 [Dreissena polymorpha]|uniref:G-protein coupled receptors family 1 profile domain-containing protein n=1 Tax=Dreissena polymorpha TaxID=45954 RepID=A0A9D3YUP3_DREPO|nr:hypothetical protein DPMN_066770 [Dreissena polymorpha]
MNTNLFLYYLMVFIVFCLATLAVIVSYTNIARTVRKSERTILDIQTSAFERQTRRSRRSSFFAWLDVRRNRIKPSSTLHVFVDTMNTRPSKPTASTANAMKLTALPSFKGGQTHEPKPRKKMTLTSSVSNIMVKPTYQISTAPIPEPAKPNVSSARDEARVRGIWSTNIGAQHSEPVKPNVSSSRNQPLVQGIRRASIKAQHSEQVEPNILSARNQPMVRGIRRASIRAICTTFLVCAIFVISWIPPWICFFIVTQPGHKLKPMVVRYMLFGRITYLLNTVANPIIYVGFNKKFREKVRGLLCFK